MSQRRGHDAGTREKGVSVKPECNNQETQTRPEDQFVLQHTMQVVQIGPENYNVDITLDRDFLALAKQGGNVKLETEGKRILTLSWTGVKEGVHAVKTSVTLNFRRLLTEVFEEFVGILSNNNMLGTLKTIIASMKDKYHARLDHVDSGSLVFVFTHQDKESATVMVADKEGVENIFRTFVNCLQTPGEFSIEVSLDPQEEGGTALTYPGSSDDNEVDPPKGKRDRKETKEKGDRLIVVESMLANLTQQVISISSVMTIQVSMFGMAELREKVAFIAQRTGYDGDREGRGRESRHSRLKPTTKHTDSYEQQPIHGLAGKSFPEAPHLENEKGPDAARVSIYEAKGTDVIGQEASRKPTVTFEGDSQTGAAFQPDEKQKDSRVPLMTERVSVSDVIQPQSGNTLQREGPSNILIVENTKSAQSHVSAVELRVAPPHSAGRQVGISKSSFDEDQHTVPSSVSFEKGDESIQDMLSAVEESCIDDVEMPPKGECMGTVLCLDTSQSMREEGLIEVKQIALDFVNGIDDIACDHGTEENIAVIKLGGRPRIVHHLSNDYTSVRGAIEHLELGGQTPLLECLQVGLCSLSGGRGCVINISGCHLLSPRVIVVTDGKPSAGYGGSSDVEDVQQNVRMHVVKEISKFKGRKTTPEFPKPFVWIPAGRADKAFLKSLSNLSGGLYMEGENVRKLCNHQRIQVAIGNSLAYLQSDSNIGSDDDVMETALEIFASDLDRESKEKQYVSGCTQPLVRSIPTCGDSVIKGIQDKLDGKDGSGNVNAAKPDFNNDVEYETLPPLGTRVVRGPHWKHKNQDSEGPGTVYQHCESQGPNQGMIMVHWDNGMTERYSFGLNESYEVCIVTDQPRCPIDEEIEIGCEVTRGPDWRSEYSEQDGGPGCVGVVIRKDDDYGVKVRWRETCFIGIYRYTMGGHRDVLLRDPVDILKEITKGGFREKETEEVIKDDVAGSATKVWTWKWLDDGNSWHEYSQEIVQKLEKAYGSNRSCLINRNQHSYRVLFKDMIEKCIDTNTRRRVKRTSVDDTYR